MFPPPRWNCIDTLGYLRYAELEMPCRSIPFVSDYYYHIYNRGSEKRRIFESRRDYQRFLKTIQYYQLEGPKPKFSHFPNLTTKELDHSKKIVEIIAYCFMSNHFHLLIRQTRDKGATEFLSKFINSYTRYFNTKYERIGPLFQGMVKAVLIESDEQLIHVSRYIHLNPYIAGLVKKPELYEWSSYPEYLGISTKKICSKEEVLENFKSLQGYEQFIMDQTGYALELEFIKHQLIEQV